MGLDMYFTAQRYLSLYPEDGKDVEISKAIHSMFPEMPADRSVKTISVEFGYWRKCNHIHKWFVDNVQDGVDECKEHYVSREDIQKLLDVVNIVLSDRDQAAALLPTQSGFFFGGTEYDEYYFETLEYTKKVMEEALSESMKGWDFYYQSSW